MPGMYPIPSADPISTAINLGQIALPFLGGLFGGNKKDEWGSGGDWSAKFLREYSGTPVHRGDTDHVGALIRQGKMSPTEAKAYLDRVVRERGGGESKSGSESGGHGGSQSSLPPAKTLFGKGGDAYIPPIEIPTYQKSERFDPIQDELQAIATDILKGEPPEYYAPIGESGGALFEKVISQISGDVMKTAQSSDIARNMGRGGTGSAPEAVARAVTPLRYEDYMRALQGRERLLGYGTDVLSNVRQADLAQKDLENKFALSTTGMKSEFDLSKSGLISNYMLGSEKAKQGWKSLALEEDSINKNFELGLISARQRDEQLALSREKMKYSQDSSEGDIWGDIFDIGITGIKDWLGGGTNTSSDILEGQSYEPFRLDLPEFTSSNYLAPKNKTYGKPILSYPIRAQ